jgi:hypothetical protein
MPKENIKMHTVLFRYGKLYAGTEDGNVSEWNVKIT